MLEFFFFWAILPPLFADIQDWLPDFGKWLREGFDLVLGGIKALFDALISIIKSSVDFIVKSVTKLFNDLAQIIVDIWEGLKWYIKEIWDYWSEFFQTVWDVTWEWIWWIGEWFWDRFIEFLDWCIGIPVDLFIWIFGLFPAIDIPDGWEKGLWLFVEFGFLLNQILPVKEVLALIVLWVMIMVFLTIVKYIWRFVIAVIP